MHSRFNCRLCPALVALLGIHFATTAVAAPGDLDPNFGQYGRAFFANPNTTLGTMRSLLQSDGKFVIVGNVQATGVTADMLAVRLNADGTADLGFGSAGRAQVDFGSFYDYASAVVQQSDGKLVLAGYSTSTPTSSGTGAVSRLNQNGTIDAAFGSGGRVTLAMMGPIGGIAVQSDGKILVAGWYNAGSGVYGYCIVRLLTSGAIDTSFGVSGVASFILPINGYGVGGLRVQSDGRILVFGTVYVSSVANAAVVRFTAAGQPDVTFNSTGYRFTPCASPLGACFWSDAVQQADQRIVLVGYSGGSAPPSTTLTQYGSKLARINVDGSIDTTFGSNGFVTSVFTNAYYGQPLHSSELGRRVVLDASGNILVLGSTLNHTYSPASVPGSAPWDAVVARFNTLGAIDPSFGFGGYAIVDFSIDAEVGYATPADFGLLPDGSLYVAAARNSGTGAIGLAKLSNGAASAGIVRLNALTAKYAETAGAAVFRVRRTGGTSGAVSVNYSTSSGTAVAASDFLPVSGTLTWANGESSEKVVAVPIIADSIVETTDESFTLNISNPTGGVRIDGTSISAPIARDDLPPDVAFQLSPSTIGVNEGQGSVAVTVTRSGTSVGAAAVTYFTVPGTATAGQDYTSTRGVLVWASGDTSSRTIIIPVTDDATSEGVEDFHLLLVNGLGVTLAGAKTTVLLSDNDSQPQISMSATTISVSELQPFITLNVMRNGAATQTVSVNYTTAAGTASAGSDFTTTTNTLTWLPADPDLKTVVIPITADTAYEGNETFAVTLSGVTGGATIGTATTTVTIVDDDAAPPPPPPPAPAASGDGGGGVLDAFWLAMLVTALYARGRGCLRWRSRVAV